MSQIEYPELIRCVDYSYFIAQKHWPLTDAIRLLFGDMINKESDWQEEERFMSLLRISRPHSSVLMTFYNYTDYSEYAECMEKESKPCLTEVDFCTVHRIEYQMAIAAIEQQTVEGKPGNIPGTFFVKAESILRWVESNGIAIPKALRGLIATKNAPLTKEKKIRNEIDHDKEKEQRDTAIAAATIAAAIKALEKDDARFSKYNRKLRRKNSLPNAIKIAEELERKPSDYFLPHDIDKVRSSGRMRLVIGRAAKNGEIT